MVSACKSRDHFLFQLSVPFRLFKTEEYLIFRDYQKMCIRDRVVAFADIAASAVSGALILSFAQKVQKSRNRKLYIVLICGYNIVLACAYVYRTLTPILSL